MKTMKSIFLLLLIVTGAIGSASGEQFRTDINPALQYFQAFNCPDLSPADRDYLFQNEWRGQKLPERFGELVAHYDNQFRLIRQAAQATVPCDWGLDMSPGPATLLPKAFEQLGARVVARRVRVSERVARDRARRDCCARRRRVLSGLERQPPATAAAVGR